MPPAGEFLALLSTGDRRDLEAIARRATAERGHVLLARGDVADRVLVLGAGRVKVSVSTPTGREAVLTFRGPGALLGEQALVDKSPRSATVVAVEPVEFLVVAASAFRGYLASHPDVALAMLAVLSARLRESDRRLAEYTAADTLGRVCARLVELCETQGDVNGEQAVRITLPITQEELAGWTGSSIEATAKALRALRSLGWVATGRRSIEVHDLAALRGRAP
ncbi:MAG TPA: Crp/Fnr family transcriptional regulator [Thermoleophilaceae bacterium]|nr:Crp/Fnr family transcriptional regulator [Thermoleophilaceae bacterium]